MEHITCPYDDALVITAETEGYDVKRVLIYSGTSIDVHFLNALKNIGKSEKDLKKVNFPLMGFASMTTYLVGAITIPVYLGKGWKALTISVTFIVVDAPTSYNTILECFTMNPN